MTRPKSAFEVAFEKNLLVFTENGIEGLKPFVKKGPPNSKLTIRKGADYRTLSGVSHLVLDMDGDLWECPHGVSYEDGREATHLDHPIELTFDGDGTVVNAIMKPPTLPVDPADEQYRRYYGIG